MAVPGEQPLNLLQTACFTRLSSMTASMTRSVPRRGSSSRVPVTRAAWPPPTSPRRLSRAIWPSMCRIPASRAACRMSLSTTA